MSRQTLHYPRRSRREPNRFWSSERLPVASCHSEGC